MQCLIFVCWLARSRAVKSMEFRTGPQISMQCEVSRVHRVRLSFNACDSVCECVYVECKVTLSHSARCINLLHTLLHTSQITASSMNRRTVRHYTSQHIYRKHAYMHTNDICFSSVCMLYLMCATCKTFLCTEFTNTSNINASHILPQQSVSVTKS